MMRLWLGVLAFISLLYCSALPVSAQISTAPSDELPIKTNGPLLITGYSFSGSSMNYVQIFNNSPTVTSLDGWQVRYEQATTDNALVELQGNLAPKRYITVADETVLPSATFGYVNTFPPAEPAITLVRLVPPSELLFNDEVVSPSISSSTVRIAGTPATFYFARTTSSSTGNYNSTFSAFVPDNAFTLASDNLYEVPPSAPLQIVEIYPDAPTCSPIDSGICSDYVKLYNPTATDIDMSNFRLRTGNYGQSSTASNTQQLSGTLAAGDYISFAINLSASGSWVWLEDTYGITRYDASMVGYPSSSGFDNQAWSYNSDQAAWMWTIYPQPGNSPNEFAVPKTVNMCEGLVISEVAANIATEAQFVELMNVSGGSVVVDGCIVQTNRSAVKSYELSGTIPSGGFITIYIKDTDLTLTKTTTGTVYLLSSDMATEVHSVHYAELSADTSYALINGEWRQTYHQTPNALNVWMKYPPCRAGYVRNTETRYCNKIQVTSVLPDCGPGKYRSIDTNRCRNLATTTVGLVPCALNQVRNPATNRCKAVETASVLKPCAANQERNPATNRCRNKMGMIQADFPVEAVADSTEATLGWWAFGGAGLLALGYAGWEWRNEMVSAIKKVTSFIPSSK